MVFRVKGDWTTHRSRAFGALEVQRPRRCLVSENSFLQELQGFALELRQLAYTMPAGHEDRLISLSERMAARSQQSRRISSRGA